MPEEHKSKHTIQRIGGYLHRIVPIVDSTGQVISHVTRPFMVEVKARDVMQMMVGASILAIPVGFDGRNLDAGHDPSLPECPHPCFRFPAVYCSLCVLQFLPISSEGIQVGFHQAGCGDLWGCPDRGGCPAHDYR